MTKNITLAVDEELLKKVRIVAANRETTVNAIVRDHLVAIVDSEEDTEGRRIAALDELRKMSALSKGRLGADYTFDREDLYGDRLLR